MVKKVLVTGAGGQAGVNVIKALINEGYTVVAADANELASGLFLTERRYVIPFANDPSFSEVLADICRNEGIDYLVPTVTPEFLSIADHIGYFNEAGVKVLMSNKDSVEKTYNKLLTSQELAKANIPAPKFGDPSTESLDDIIDRVGFPIFLKPINESGSRGTAKAEDREDLEYALKKSNGVIVQEFIDGKEYTVDCLFDEESNVIAHVVRERIEVKAGYSVKGVTVVNREMEDISSRVGKAFKLQYAACIQYIVDNNGPKLIEINPRFGGGLSLSTAAGINMPDIALRMLDGEKFNHLDYKEGVKMTRRFEDTYIINGKPYPKVSSIIEAYKPRIILAIGAHPDDIEIGCGGSLIAHKENGHRVYGLILSDGEKGGDREIRLEEAKKSAKVMGLDDLYFLHLYDANIAEGVSTIDKIKEIINKVNPDTIYTHTDKDSHQDHRNTSKAVRSAAHNISRIFLFEGVRTYPEFNPHVNVDITSTYERKIAAVCCHESQEGKSFTVDRIAAMGSYWGIKTNVKYAEAFEPNHLFLGPRQV